MILFYPSMFHFILSLFENIEIRNMVHNFEKTLKLYCAEVQNHKNKKCLLLIPDVKILDNNSLRFWAKILIFLWIFQNVMYIYNNFVFFYIKFYFILYVKMVKIVRIYLVIVDIIIQKMIKLMHF